jgi:hypothetical protein
VGGTQGNPSLTATTSRLRCFQAMRAQPGGWVESVTKAATPMDLGRGSDFAFLSCEQPRRSCLKADEDSKQKGLALSQAGE